MSELEKGLKAQLESVIKQNQMLLEKHYQQDSKIVKLIEENNYYKNQLQQKDTIINEFMEELKWQRKVSLSLNEAFAVSRIDILINCLQELKGDNK